MYIHSRKCVDLSNIMVHVVSGDKARWPPPVGVLASLLTTPPDCPEDTERGRSMEGLPGLAHNVRDLAATLRYMASHDVPEFSNPKTSILASMVATVTRHCAPDLFVLERPCFATSRPPRPDYHNLAHFFSMEETATLLVMLDVVEFLDRLKKAQAAEEAQDLGMENDSNDSSSCTKNEAVERQNKNEDEDLFEGSLVDGDASDEDDYSSQASFSPRRYTAEELAAGGYFSEDEEPRSMRTFYEHATSTPAVASVTDHTALTYISPAFRNCSPAIPIVCMAEYGTIFSLLKSAVYQRRVWGICEPVAGLAFEPANPVVQVVFAWADELENNGFPVVHIAMCSPHHTPNVPFGLFDASDARSAVELSRYLVNLSGHVSRVRSAASSNVEKTVASVLGKDTLDWRFDFVGPSVPLGDEDDKSTWISAWSENITMDSVPNGELVTPPSPPSHISPHSGEMPPSTRSKNTISRQAAGTGPSSERDQSQTGTTTSPQPANPPSFSVSNHDEDAGSNNQPPTDASSNRTKRYSCSKFAAGGKHQDPNYLTDKWLADRSVTRHTLLALEGNVKIPKQYTTFTKFGWPKAWATIDDLPKVDESYEELKRELFESKIATFKGDIRADESLDQNIVDALRAGFTCILQACKRARDLKEDAKRHDVAEIECRHEWDSLMIEFMKGKHGVGAWLERTIKLPRNERAVQLVDKRFTTNLAMLREAYMQSQLNIIRVLHNLQFQDLLEQERAVLNSISEKMTVDSSPSSVQSRANLDPYTGRCDALAAVEVRNFIPSHAKRALKQAARGFAFSSQTPARNTGRSSSKSADQSSEATSSQYLDVPGPSRDPPSEMSTAAYDLFHRNLQSDDVLRLGSNPDVNIADMFGSLSLGSSLPAPADTNLDEGNPNDLGYSLDLPLFVVEYKKMQTDFTVTGANQLRIYSTAAASFLAAVGITEFPVFGLLTDGCKGVITCAWAETESDTQCVRIAERNGVVFDLSDPLSAFQYAVLLCKLAHQHSPTLLGEFSGEVRKNLLDRLALPKRRDIGNIGKNTTSGKNTATGKNTGTGKNIDVGKNPDIRWSMAQQTEDLKKALSITEGGRRT
ncbi:hypothetical protein F5I97DRAFT_1874317 [Phlebopus sp. FC_14]|nr:hypothetical protein F5I97DRAFT_1874317 [Phlebopus sp. FC_14]